MINEKLIEILRCPICKSKVMYDENSNKIICSNCKNKYDVEDEIPVMLQNEKDKKID